MIGPGAPAAETAKDPSIRLVQQPGSYGGAWIWQWATVVLTSSVYYVLASWPVVIVVTYWPAGLGNQKEGQRRGIREEAPVPREERVVGEIEADGTRTAETDTLYCSDISFFLSSSKPGSVRK